MLVPIRKSTNPGLTGRMADGRLVFNRTPWAMSLLSFVSGDIGLYDSMPYLLLIYIFAFGRIMVAPSNEQANEIIILFKYKKTPDSTPWRDKTTKLDRRSLSDQFVLIEVTKSRVLFRDFKTSLESIFFCIIRQSTRNRKYRSSVDGGFYKFSANSGRRSHV